MCIAAAQSLFGPGPAAIALGTAVAEGLLNPAVIGVGTMTAEALGRFGLSLGTTADFVGANGRSPDFRPDLGHAIGVGFTVMSFALAYQAAMDGPRTSFAEIYVPSAIGGGVTGAVAMGAAMLGKQGRQLDALMRRVPLANENELIVEGPQDEGARCGERLLDRLQLKYGEATADGPKSLKTFAVTRMQAYFEANREVVLGFVPVILAQIIANIMLPMIDPSKDENIFGLYDKPFMDAQTQYALLAATVTALIHNVRVDGWTNWLTDTPVPKAGMQPTDAARLVNQFGAALINVTVACIAGFIIHTLVASGEDESIANAVYEQAHEWVGGLDVPQVVESILTTMLLLRAVVGNGEGVLRFREGMASAAVGLAAGAIGGATGTVSVQAGAAIAAGVHALVPPAHGVKLKIGGLTGFVGQASRPVISGLSFVRCMGGGLAQMLAPVAFGYHVPPDAVADAGFENMNAGVGHVIDIPRDSESKHADPLARNSETKQLNQPDDEQVPLVQGGDDNEGALDELVSGHVRQEESRDSLSRTQAGRQAAETKAGGESDQEYEDGAFSTSSQGSGSGMSRQASDVNSEAAPSSASVRMPASVPLQQSPQPDPTAIPRAQRLVQLAQVVYQTGGKITPALSARVEKLNEGDRAIFQAELDRLQRR
jgi:hypothetical protein